MFYYVQIHKFYFVARYTHLSRAAALENFELDESLLTGVCRVFVSKTTQSRNRYSPKVTANEINSIEGTLL